MNNKTKFVYENFNGANNGKGNDGRVTIRNLTNIIQSESRGHQNSSCVPAMDFQIPLLNAMSKNKAQPDPTMYQPGNDIENGEIILESFRCALELRILIQGKIFISNKAIYFYSYFNDQGLIFGKETKIKINYSEIKDIRKAKNAIFFPNSITITLVDD